MPTPGSPTTSSTHPPPKIPVERRADITQLTLPADEPGGVRLVRAHVPGRASVSGQPRVGERTPDMLTKPRSAAIVLGGSSGRYVSVAIASGLRPAGVAGPFVTGAQFTAWFASVAPGS